jgi:hypothetical protein
VSSWPLIWLAARTGVVNEVVPPERPPRATETTVFTPAVSAVTFCEYETDDGTYSLPCRKPDPLTENTAGATDPTTVMVTFVDAEILLLPCTDATTVMMYCDCCTAFK